MKTPSKQRGGEAHFTTVTEQEAEALAAKLTRIWTPTRALLEFAPDQFRFEYRGYWGDRTRLMVACVIPLGAIPISTFYFNVEGWKKGRYRYYLSYRTDTQNRSFDVTHLPQDFVSHWLPLFRRGCWLSGCDTEATAHEKVEWMQGFSREELGAWDLKI